MSDPLDESIVQSPCIGVCQLDARQLCTGCRRHIDEIAEWSLATPARRVEIRRAAAQRACGDAPLVESCQALSEK